MKTDETDIEVDIAELARAHGMAAIDTLAEIMTCADAPATARVSAARALLDRGWGKVATQPAEGGGSLNETPPLSSAHVESPSHGRSPARAVCPFGDSPGRCETRKRPHFTRGGRSQRFGPGIRAGGVGKEFGLVRPLSIHRRHGGLAPGSGGLAEPALPPERRDRSGKACLAAQR